MTLSDDCGYPSLILYPNSTRESLLPGRKVESGTTPINFCTIHFSLLHFE